MRSLIAAGDVATATRIRAMLAKEDVICDATDLGRDSFLLSRLYDYDIILLDLTVADNEGYKLLQQLRSADDANAFASRQSTQNNYRPRGCRRGKF